LTIVPQAINIPDTMTSIRLT